MCAFHHLNYRRARLPWTNKNAKAICQSRCRGRIACQRRALVPSRRGAPVQEQVHRGYGKQSKAQHRGAEVFRFRVSAQLVECFCLMPPCQRPIPTTYVGRSNQAVELIPKLDETSSRIPISASRTGWPNSMPRYAYVRDGS